MYGMRHGGRRASRAAAHGAARGLGGGRARRGDDARRGRRGDADQPARAAQPDSPGGRRARQRRRLAARLVARRERQRGAPDADQRPLLGAHPGGREHRPEAGARPRPQGRRDRDGARLRDAQRGRRGGRRAGRAVALRRDGRASPGPRGLEPVHGRRPAARHARGPVRGADADGRDRGGAAVHHRAPRRRRAAVARGRDRARRRRARHGQGPLADPVRRGSHLDPLAVGGRDRDGHDPGRRGAPDPGRDRDEQLGRRLPDRRAAAEEAARLRARGLDRGVRPHRGRGREAARPRRPACEAARPRTPPAAREGPDGCALRGAARRGHARAGRAPVARPLQPRVPAGVRRDAAPVPADTPAGARRRAAAQHRPQRGRGLHDGRPAQRRLVHDQLRARLRDDADGLPGGASAGRAAGPDPDLHPARAMPASRLSRFGEDTRSPRGLP